MSDRFRFRTPIYRADGKFKKFVYWNAESGFPAVTCRNGDVFKAPEQCTGLKDANECLLYEGDIVNILCEVEEQGVIEWAPEEAQFVVRAEQAGFVANFDNYRGTDLEVIGNIHENMELLEMENAK
jgi:hypothetical protein